MAKPQRKRPAQPKHTATATPLKIDQKEVERLVQLAFNGSAVLVPASCPTPPVHSSAERKVQILRSFFQKVDFEQLEEDVETLQELQMMINRRGDDNASDAVGRVIELLETLQDTGETCGFSSVQ